jgi:hypothetical protein
VTWIEANCPTCGTVDCAPGIFTLAICSDKSSSFYRFQCPVCGDSVQKHADARVIELLVAEGIAPVQWEFPAEMREAHNGPSITMDDVLDMHLLLQRADWFEHLTQHAE